MLDYQRRCPNCNTLFITTRPAARYCGQVCAGEGTQAMLRDSTKDPLYQDWLAGSALAREYLSKPWK